MEDSGPQQTAGDGLHAQQHERVLRLVPRVREGVFLPELAEEVLHGYHAAEVAGEVAFEEEVDEAAYIHSFIHLFIYSFVRSFVHFIN